MFDKVQQSFLFFLKNIQITIRTWRNAVEIGRAYAHPSQIQESLYRHLKKGILLLLIITAVALISIAVFYVSKKVTMSRKQKIDHPSVQVIQKKVTSKKIIPSKKSTVIESITTVTEPVAVQESLTVIDTPEIIKPTVKKYAFHPLKDSSDYLVLIANKAVKALYLLQKQDDIWKVVREYAIAIGEEEGQKQVAGDRRTPEGYYFIIGRKERSELSSIYGPLAYVLDYPNEDDRRAGRTGTGIWIHGTDPDSLPLDTRGCIEMENSELKELSSLLKSGIGTPVVIVYDPNLDRPSLKPDFQRCEQRRRVVMEEYAIVKTQFSLLVDAWKSSWEQKKIEEYQMFYDTTDFKGQGLEWQAWRERKLRTFNLYDTIAISINDILITDFAESLTIVKFLQQYKTNINNIINGKKLLFRKIDDNWKITGESTCSQEELLL